MQDPFRTICVLVVADDRPIANSLTAALTESGYEAYPVYNCEAALNWCRLNAPDAVVTEVILGRIDGIQLATQIVSGRPQCKVLLIADEVITSMLLAAATSIHGGFPILTKPIDPQAVLDFLATV